MVRVCTHRWNASRLIKRLRAPQIVPDTDKLWDLLLVLPLSDLLLLILRKERPHQSVSSISKQLIKSEMYFSIMTDF